MDQIYKIGVLLALPDERLMEAVDEYPAVSKPFVCATDLVSAKDVYEGALVAGFYYFGEGKRV